MEGKIKIIIIVIIFITVTYSVVKTIEQRIEWKNGTKNDKDKENKI